MSIRVKKMMVGPIMTNCYIVYDENIKKAVVVDPGDEADRISIALGNEGVELVAILLTHGHFDHVGAVDDLRKKYQVPVYAYELEEEVLTTEFNLGPMIGKHRLCVRSDKFVADHEKLNLGGMEFEVLYTPGHTIGSCCYYMEKEGVLFSGDTLFYCSHGRTDFPTGSQSAIIRSIRERLLVLPEDTMVYPGHECQTTIGDERAQYE